MCSVVDGVVRASARPRGEVDVGCELGRTSRQRSQGGELEPTTRPSLARPADVPQPRHRPHHIICTRHTTDPSFASYLSTRRSLAMASASPQPEASTSSKPLDAVVPSAGSSSLSKLVGKPKKKAISPGIVYISRIPPGMTPQKIKHLMGRWGETGKVYAQKDGPSGGDPGSKSKSECTLGPRVVWDDSLYTLMVRGADCGRCLYVVQLTLSGTRRRGSSSSTRPSQSRQQTCSTLSRSEEQKERGKSHRYSCV